ncbi:hypothetical protein PFISCL1PPCAC_9285, partial [Pristionchus fissidentatus]
ISSSIFSFSLLSRLDFSCFERGFIIVSLMSLHLHHSHFSSLVFLLFASLLPISSDLFSLRLSSSFSELPEMSPCRCDLCIHIRRPLL